MRKNYLKPEQIITALEANGGFVTEAAKALGITYQGLRDRIRRDKKIAEAYEAIVERHLDFAESKLLEAVKKGEAWAICFLLKCKGKHRGWVERQEITGADGGPMKVTFVTSFSENVEIKE